MKKRNMRVFAVLGLSAAMIVGMTACGTSGSDTAQTSSETSEAATEEASAEKVSLVVAADAETESTVNGMDDGLCSWTTGGTDASTINGDDYSFTPTVYVDGGTYQADKSIAGESEAVTDTEVSNLDLTIEKTGINGIIINNSDYTVSDSTITVDTPDADGSDTCDFSGLGTALAIYGDSNVTVEDTEISADGVANLAVFADNGATALLNRVTLHSDGGTLYEDYINSPNQGTMVAPPWILGIMGTSRATNLMGDDSTMSVVDSTVSASNWAVLSTDSGSNMYLNVVNTDMSLTGSEDSMQADGTYDVENPYTDKSGYGTYAIGNAVETFLGTTMNVGTYATIFTGGTGYYGNLVAGESYDLLAADGSIHYTYEATEDVETVINSDTFGFMAHQGDNTVTLDGVTVNSAFTGFVIKSGNNTTINVENGATINAENGILLQLMDNDDSTTEFNTNDETVGMAFGTSHEEYAGFPTEAVDVSAGASADAEMAADVAENGNLGDAEGEAPADDAAAEGEAPEGEAPEGEAPEGEGGDAAAEGGEEESGTNQAVYNIIDTDLEGSIYNGIGWNANDLSQGTIKQMLLDVNISGTSTLKGAIASTSCIHATYDGQSYLKENGITAFDNDDDAADFASQYQATSFTLSEYFNICQVANKVSYNGLNDINVTVSDSAVWTVTGTSLVKTLTVSDDAQVVVEDGATLTVGDQVYEAGTYTAADFQ